MKILAGIISIIIFISYHAYSSDINFDQGNSGKSIIKDAGYVQLPPVGYQMPGSRRTTRDCRRVSFGPSDNELRSEKINLRSEEYITQCYTVYVPGPNGQQMPQQQCYEQLYNTYYARAEINVKPRKLWPWEIESFEVCLDGSFLDLYTVEAGYKYKIKRTGYNDVLFELYPEYKIATKPDPDGINYTEFSYNKDTKKYTFKLTDRWAKEYNGEKVKIKIELKKDIANWFDSSLGTKEITFDVANNYTLEFSEDELIKPQNDTNNNEGISRAKLFETKGYYLKWGFSRIGSISKDTFIDKGETNRISK